MSAPSYNRVNALTGEVAERPSQFFKALSEADFLCRELEGVAELRTRVQELTEELAEEKQRGADLWAENQDLRTKLARAENARDTAQAAVTR